MRILHHRRLLARSGRAIRPRILSPPLLVMLLALLAPPLAAVAALLPLKAVDRVEARESGFIEITLRTCPGGYDPAADDAEPERDCALAPDGVRFTLRDDDPATDDRHAATGEREDGVAFFADVAGGQYVLAEDVPDGVERVIILACQGFNTGVVLHVPLEEGPELIIPAPENAPISCDWFNIAAPGASPVASPIVTPEATPDGAAG